MCHSHVVAQLEVTMRGLLTLLWAQPTPHTITIVALSQESTYLISNYESHKLYFKFHDNS